jgi:SAM-dependent methyltransferase
MTWDDRFAARYDEWSAGMTQDVPFYVGLALETSGPVVELAVGDGRVAIPVARAIGRKVIGIDSSATMLDAARSAAEHADVELDLRAGDIRDLALDEPAELVYCPFNSLLHLPTWADRRRTFERVAAALRPGGRFAWNALVFDHHVAVRFDGHRQLEPVPHTARYDRADNRIDLTLDGGGTSSLWWATRNEWLALIDVAGLRLDALHGDFEGGPLVAESDRYVFVASRPSAEVSSSS